MKGRGAKHNQINPYQSHHYDYEDEDHIDEAKYEDSIRTQYFITTPKTILSKNDSPDIPFTFSINPYQGCEHGCAYCYARNSHHYWGYGTGLDFESKIMVKKNAATLLEKAFLKPGWQPQTIALSGNTDCYQPAEAKFKITRNLLLKFLQYGNPAGIITKNHLILRDKEILAELAKENLVKVIFTITSLNNKLRSKLEPRTSTAKSKLNAIGQLTDLNVPTGVMVGPIIPGLTDHELEPILKLAADAGARDASYTMLRLNGQLSGIFEQWLDLNYPDRKVKILNKVKEAHAGKLNDTKWKRRMRGEGNTAEIIAKMFRIYRAKYFKNQPSQPLSIDRFRRNGNLSLF